MSRLPVHVQILLYKKDKRDEYLFALFQRSDFKQYWQGICGGGETGESLKESALRECQEEGGITSPGPLYKLETTGFAPATVMAKWAPIWGEDVLVIPMYFYGMPYEGDIILSDEHLDFKWLSFEEGTKIMLAYDHKTALWELNERLKRGNLEACLV